jgi:hypothetical protein
MEAPGQGDPAGAGRPSDLSDLAGQTIQQNTQTPMQTANQFHPRCVILRPYEH